MQTTISLQSYTFANSKIARSTLQKGFQLSTILCGTNGCCGSNMSTKNMSNKRAMFAERNQRLRTGAKEPFPHLINGHVTKLQNILQFAIWKYLTLLGTLLPAVHFLEQAFAGADFSTEKFSAALSLISAALFQCPKIAKFSVAHFLNFRAISVALFQLPKVVKFSVAHLQTSERVQN